MISVPDLIELLSGDTGFAASSGGGALLAGEDVSAHREVAEQVQVRAVHERAGDEVGGLVVAGLAGHHVVPAGHAHAGADEHLRNLGDGDDHRREGLGAHAQRLQAVVAVHERVHGVVHGDKVQSRARHRGVGAPAEEQHGHVVVPVEEDQRLSSEHNEQSVDQLRHLAEDEEHDPETRRTRTPGVQAILTHSLFVRQSHNVVDQGGQL